MSETKDRILDTAERLFGEHGYAATSLRHITAEAGVNLAAIHYHFGSKEDLLDQVVIRKAGPVNDDRLALLDRFESEAAGAPVPVEKVLEALIMPAILTALRSPEFPRLMGRLYGEGLMPSIARRHFKEALLERFFTALQRSSPELPRDELIWRSHFMIGAMAHTLCWSPELKRKASAEGPSAIACRLVAFLAGGFRAPLPDLPRDEDAGKKIEVK